MALQITLPFVFWELLAAVRGDSANQFDEACNNAQDQAREIEPGGMQPFVEPNTDQPSHKRRCRENQGELAVAGELHPIVLLFGSGIVGQVILARQPLALGR